jgi:CRISPR system Cascade subunit CasE
MQAFPNCASGQTARSANGVLHRLDISPVGALLLLVQSAIEPRPWIEVLPLGYTVAKTPDRGVAIREASAILDAVVEGAVFEFRLRANPTKRLAKSTPGSRLGKGARVGLRTFPEQLAWLDRKASEHGFEIHVEDGCIPNVVDRERGRSFGKGRALVFEGVTFEGQLRVGDPLRFREALKAGIGSGKAFGFGLLTIARSGSRSR